MVDVIGTAMKILYVDIILNGHHQAYLKALVDDPGYDRILLLPEKCSELRCTQYTFTPMDFYHKKLSEYLRWIKEVKEIAQREKVDIIHFLYGDIFYKYFGLGLGSLDRKYKIILTLHGKREGAIYDLILKRIFQSINIGVVHTVAIQGSLKKIGINNAAHIEYPCFAPYKDMDREEARICLDIPKETKLIGCLGGTRYDKGLDLLLASIQELSSDYEVLIAGNSEAWDESEIWALAGPSQKHIRLILRYLTDAEFQTILSACDIIVLPYRKCFNGASGPLAEVVWNKKIIVGSDHGSLGAVIKEHHLGYVFKSEDTHSLSQALEKALNLDFKYDDKALEYRGSLSVEHFKDSYRALYKKAEMDV